MAKREYIATVVRNRHGQSTEEFKFESDHAAGSAANRRDAMREWSRGKEQAVSRDSIIICTRPA